MIGQVRKRGSSVAAVVEKSAFGTARCIVTRVASAAVVAADVAAKMLLLLFVVGE